MILFFPFLNNHFSKIWYKYNSFTRYVTVFQKRSTSASIMIMQVETLYDFVRWTIETELADELKFIANYDRAKKAIQEIVDMPDRYIDLLIRFILQNHGKLSRSKQKSHFDFLNNDEIIKIEQAVWQPGQGDES